MTEFATICTITIPSGTETVFSTTNVFSTQPTITTLKGVTTSTVTFTKFRRGGPTTTDTITLTHAKQTVSTTTTTVTPIFTAPVPTISNFAACGPQNQLNFTFGGSSDNNAGGSGSLFKRDGGSGSAQGIGNITLSSGFSTAVAPGGPIGAFACCEACFILPNCAGTYTDADGNCNIVTVTAGESCSLSNSLGSFFGTETGEGDIVSNGQCGIWSNGGSAEAGGSSLNEGGFGF